MVSLFYKLHLRFSCLTWIDTLKFKLSQEMYNRLHLSAVTSVTTPTDRRTVKTSSHLLSHKDNISHYFTCFQYNPMLLQPKHCLASVSANRVINIHIFTEMRWETHWRAHIHTHKRKYTHTPQREISWLLKYNYLTAGCHLGWCLDRLSSSLSLCLFSVFLSILAFPATGCFFPLSLFSTICLLWNIAQQIQKCWFDSIDKCFIGAIFIINSTLQAELNCKVWLCFCRNTLAFKLWNPDEGHETHNLQVSFSLEMLHKFWNTATSIPPGGIA